MRYEGVINDCFICYFLTNQYFEKGDMALTGSRTFIGFGFGPIQAGLFLKEAYDSGKFGRLSVAEVMPGLVESIRQTSGWYSLNVARRDRIEIDRVGPIEILDPACPHDRDTIVRLVAEAEEIATAVPSPKQYVSDQPGSIHCLLAEGLREKARSGGPRAVVYAAENHNFAAEILEAEVFQLIPSGEKPAVHGKVRFLNTVIGKMSGVIPDPAEIAQRGLAAITPSFQRAFFVEEFNRILISRTGRNADKKTWRDRYAVHACRLPGVCRRPAGPDGKSLSARLRQPRGQGSGKETWLERPAGRNRPGGAADGGGCTALRHWHRGGTRDDL
jgi:hypothetical protein